MFCFFLLILLLGIHCFAESHACDDLKDKAKLFILQFFPEVVQFEEFLCLSKSKLVEFISNDDLCVDSEEIVFNAVMMWLSKNDSESTNDFYKVGLIIIFCVFVLFNNLQ